MEEKYQQLIEKFGNRIKQDVPLAPYTTFKIGGPADLFYEAKTKEELVAVVSFARTIAVPFFILGGGTNILIGDKGFRGLVIKNSTEHMSIVGMKGTVSADAHQTVYLEVDSGVNFNKLVRFTLGEGLGGLEMHLGLPGTVGGAIYMNSKWMQKKAFVGDCVHQAMILDESGTVKTVSRSYFQFAYGKSALQTDHGILLSVTFVLTKSDKDALWAVANESVTYRQTTQPHGATAGCVFKNISLADALTVPTPDHTTSVGKLIDLAGLKGFSVGDAQFSSVHANFIVNTGHASASDVIELIRIAKEKIQKIFGLTLKEEIGFIGSF